MSNDIYDILKKFDTLVEGTTPTSVKHGLNAQQKSVPQLPALFKPKHISVLQNKTDPTHPMKGYALGDSIEHNEKALEETDENEYIQRRRGKNPEELGNADAWYHRGLIPNYYGFQKGSQEFNDYIKGFNDWDEGPSGGKQWDESVVESKTAATEDLISNVKKKLGDYLQDVASAINKDPDLLDKIPGEVDKIGPAVKTITTDDGHEIKIHGNEDDGFRITIKNKPSKSKFESLDHAVMACEMFCAKRKQIAGDTDYLDEKQ